MFLAISNFTGLFLAGVSVPVRESAGPRVRGATSPRGRGAASHIYIHRCTVPAVNNAGSTTGCRDAIDEYNSFYKYFFTGEGAAPPFQTPPPHPTTSLL